MKISSTTMFRDTLIRAAMILAACSLEAQVQKPLSGSNEASNASIGTNLFTSGINQFTGQVQFSMPLMTISGKGQLGYQIAATYSSLVQSQAKTWNRDAPTSVIGLGWNLVRPKIVADPKNTVNREDDDFYYSGPEGQLELVYSGMDGTDWSFYTKPYQFWKIRYSPSTEQWTITKEDGMRILFGGSVARKTIEYMVGVRDWIGDTNQSSGGVQVAYIWDLSSLVDLFDDAITFEYIHDTDWIAGRSSDWQHHLHQPCYFVPI